MTKLRSKRDTTVVLVLRLLVLTLIAIGKVPFGASPGAALVSWGAAAALVSLTLRGQLLLPSIFFAPLSLLTVAVVMIQQLELLALYLHGDSFSRAFFYHLEPGTLAVVKVYLPLAMASLLLLLLVIAGDVLLWRRRGFSGRSSRWVLAVALGLLFLCWPLSSERRFLQGLNEHLELTAKKLAVRPEDQHILENSGVDVDRLFSPPSIEIREGPRNLVFIYLESLEQQFFDTDRFPGLLPVLDALRESSLDFIDARQRPGTEFTTAALFSSQCGLPMSVLSARQNNEAIGYEGSELLVCLGDLLHEAGYTQLFLQGSPLRFAAIGRLFQDHRFDRMLGLNNLDEVLGEKPRGVWGYDDAQLFHAASLVLAQLEREQPFNLTIATMDTHHPGIPSPGCPEYSDDPDSLLQAAHCTDLLVGRFLAELARRPFAERTLVVLMSDHLSMHHAYREAPDRRLTLLVRDSARSGRIEVPVTHFDLPPILLDLMGIETDAHFPFGRNVLDGRGPAAEVLLSMIEELPRIIKYAIIYYYKIFHARMTFFRNKHPGGRRIG